MSAAPSVALVPYLGSGDEGVAAWARLAPGERRRTAMQAARDHDGATLWSLTEAWLRTFGPAGATVAPGAVRSYRCGVHALPAAWTELDLLRRPRRGHDLHSAARAPGPRPLHHSGARRRRTGLVCGPALVPRPGR